MLWYLSGLTAPVLRNQPSCNPLLTKFVPEFGKLFRSAKYKVLSSPGYLIDKRQTATQQAWAQQTWPTFSRGRNTARWGLGFSNLLHRGATSWSTQVLCLPDATMDQITHNIVLSCFLLLSPLPLKKHPFHQPSDQSQCSLLEKHVLLQQEGSLCREIFHYFTTAHKSPIPYPW